MERLGRDVVHEICTNQVVVTLQATVKELVENSLDAGATRVEVRLRESGSEILEVVDNGHGISPENYERVAQRHATSKIRDFEDLSKTLDTFGFRGEALAAICAMGEVTICTRTAEDASAALLTYDRFGKLESRAVAAREVGTTVSVRELFKRIPVRHREFLRNAKAQVSSMLRLVQSYSVAQPEIKFHVVAEKGRGNGAGRAALLSTSGAPRGWRQAAAAVFGDAALADTQPLELNNPETGWAVSGLISMPSGGRRSRDLQLFFVNRRPIDPPKRIVKLINDTFHQYHTRAWPAVVLSFSAAQSLVDVNVTPDKRTVFLHNEESLLSDLQKGLTELYSGSNKGLQAMGPSLAAPRAQRGGPAAAPADHDADAALPAAAQPQPAQAPTADPSAAGLGAAPPAREAATPHACARAAGPGPRGGAADPTTPEKLSGPGSGTAPAGAAGGATAAPGPLLRWATKAAEAPRREAAAPTPPAPEAPPARAAEPEAGSASGAAANSLQNPFDDEDGVDGGATLPSSGLAEAAAAAAAMPAAAEAGAAEAEQRPAPPTSFARPLGRPHDLEGSVLPLVDVAEVEPVRAAAAGGANSLQDPWAEEADEVDDVMPPGALLGSTGPAAGPAQLASSGQCGSQAGSAAAAANGAAGDGAAAAAPGGGAAAQSARLQVGPSICAATSLPELEASLARRRARAAARASTGPEGGAGAVAPEVQFPSAFSLSSLAAGASQGGSSLEEVAKFATGGKAGEADPDVDGASFAFDQSCFTKMRVIGQFNLGFIITALRANKRSGSGDNAGRPTGVQLFIVDQHASDEKFRFEGLNRESKIDRQPLVSPHYMQLTPAQEQLASAHAEIFRLNGFELGADESRPPGRRLRLTTLPTCRGLVFGERDVHELLHTLEQAETDRSQPSTRDASAGGGLLDLAGHRGLWSAVAVPRPPKVWELLACRACRGAIMIGKALRATEMERVLANLAGLRQPWNCPHGRPTVRHLAAAGGGQRAAGARPGPLAALLAEAAEAADDAGTAC